MSKFKEMAMNVQEFIARVGNAFNGNVLITILTIGVLFVLFYFAISTLGKNNANRVIFIFIFYVLTTGVIFMVAEISGWDYFIMPLLFIVAVVAMFATEIKREIWTFNSKKATDIKHLENPSENEESERCIDAIISALQTMSKNDVGAIIVLSDGNIPKSTVESGTILDAEISSALIGSVFFPKSPLHDGALIINGTRVEAAGCFLPLTENSNQPKELGTRHRAGIGITETVDVTSIIVSEETGIISIVRKGAIRRNADSEMLRRTLKEYYWQQSISSGKED